MVGVKRPGKRWVVIVLLFAAVVAGWSFTATPQAAPRAAQWYDRQLNVLQQQLSAFQKAARAGVGADSLRKHFFASRMVYKRTELFTDLFTPPIARQLNGPDLLKIEDENPSDSLKPHGFQVLERVLYTTPFSRAALVAELQYMSTTVHRLQTDPDRQYYFTDGRVWMAMRLALFRVVSLGITGFDVPMSFHALPETREVLRTLKELSGYYSYALPDSSRRQGGILFARADSFVQRGKSFNTFDRLTFIRDYVNPLSAWLTSWGVPYRGDAGIWPLQPAAPHLFAEGIANMAFFSPDTAYAVTPARVALGRKLFYDPILSGDGSRSCGSCHHPDKAFTDGLPKPYDLAGKKLLLRNTPTLWNSALQTAQFYDSRTRVLERQLSDVVHNVDEMNGSLTDALPRLLYDSSYVALFRAAYPATPAPTEYHIANAMSSYVRSLVGLRSRFDRYVRGETSDFSPAEKNGFNLFMGKAKCGTCHYAPFFNGLTPPLYQETESETLGVPAADGPGAVLDTDPGRYKFTRLPLHQYSFRTPTVRNAALTAPYMHNGAFATLESVIDFYNDGGGAGRGIDIPTQTLPADKLGLTPAEKQDIIAFLHALTDTVTVY